jgi:predicted DCC family thiol-disulfide oxidoreductase YuxK
MENAAIVIFDGTCNFCDASVRFMIANDPVGYFRFAASQSDAGVAALRAAGRDPGTIESIVLIDREGFHERSDAALRIAAGLRFPWRALTILRAIPVGLRDRVYDIVARNRYRWFGRRERCRLPTPAVRARFL